MVLTPVSLDQLALMRAMARPLAAFSSTALATYNAGISRVPPNRSPTRVLPTWLGNLT